MKEITATFKKATLLKEIQTILFYISRKNNSSETFKAASDVQATEEDYPIIRTFFDTAITAISDETSLYVKTVTNNETDIQFDFLVSDLFMDNMESVLSDSIKQYIINRAITEWLLITMPTEAEQYGQKAVGCLDSLIPIFNRRASLPKRTSTPF